MADSNRGGGTMKLFSRVMTIAGILILLGTCALLLGEANGAVQLGPAKSSVVFCALGLALLCYSPRRYLAYDESIKVGDEKKAPQFLATFILQSAAGLIMVIISIVKYFLTINSLA
ncbi:MAG: hypothetical protein IKS30_02120 [Treponema sp.]|nr:hypothetical protein [Treponema sp.]